MMIDFIYGCLLVLALFKGFQKGFVVAVFSFFAIVVGLAAAVKLSEVVAAWLGTNTTVHARFLPVIAFVLVMAGVGLIVRFVGVIIQKALQIAMMGLLNKMAGIMLYVLLYTILLSVVLFYAQQIHWISQETIAASQSYQFVQPWGPQAIKLFAIVLPAFENLFQHLEQFFEALAKKAA